MTAEEVIRFLEGDAVQRLKWIVLREFGILPGSKQARELKDKDFVICGANMVLDGRLRSRGGCVEGARNVCFDEKRFSELLEGSV